MNEYLDHKFIVASHQMDHCGYMKPTEILNICQECAYMHSSLLGFGYKMLLALDSTWVLSRVKIEVERMPQWQDEIRVRTWHKGQSGLFALRDYIFFDSLDNPIIRVTTSWLIINISSRRITRVDRVFSAQNQNKLVEYNCDALTEEAEKVELTGDRVALDSHRVAYSDLDINHHVNNTKYLRWACDRSPEQMSPQRVLSKICLNFNHEALWGECVDISCQQPHDDRVVMQGDVAGRNIFTAALSYRDR